MSALRISRDSELVPARHTSLSVGLLDLDHLIASEGIHRDFLLLP